MVAANGLIKRNVLDRLIGAARNVIKEDKMVKRLNEAFSDEDHQSMKEAKQKLMVSFGLKRLSWEKYLLHVSGVKKL